MANKKQFDAHLLHLSTTQTFKCTQQIIHFIYLELVLIHPSQIQSLKSSVININDQSKRTLITIRFRSISERNVCFFKVHSNQFKADLNLNLEAHSPNILQTLRKEVCVITFASLARALRYNSHGSKCSNTLPSCLIRRWKGLAVIKTDSPYVSIEVPIEPYYELKNQLRESSNAHIPLLHTLPPPYVLRFKIFREDCIEMIPTSTDEIRAYQIHLRRIPSIDKLTLILPKERKYDQIASDNAICRWNDKYCPKQHHKLSPCPYKHKAWLEPDIDDGNNDNDWESQNVMSWEPAAHLWKTRQEFNIESSDLVDVLQYSSVIGMEFVTMSPRDYQLLDDRLNKLMKHKMKDEVDLCRIPTDYPNHIGLNFKNKQYISPFVYEKRDKDNIPSILSYMEQWNRDERSQISFAVKACITNWPKILIPEDIDDSFLNEIDRDLKILSVEEVCCTLLIVAQNERFRAKYVQQFNTTASEMYSNAKDSLQEEVNDKFDQTQYALRWIKILPFDMQLNMYYIKPNTIFSNTREGRAYAKLTFITQNNAMEHTKHHYKPIQFAQHSDTLTQVQHVLRDGVMIGNTTYQMIWYGDRDCKQSTVTMVSPALLPLGYTPSGLRIKHRLNTMLNQESRMKHCDGLESSCVQSKRIWLKCITEIRNDNRLFDGCGIINKQWLWDIIKHNRLFGYKPAANDDKFKHMDELNKCTRTQLEEYLAHKGRPARPKMDKYVLIDLIESLWKHEKEILKGGGYDNLTGQDEYPITMQPIEAEIGGISCILVPYPQTEIDQIIAKHGTKHTNKKAYIYLPDNMYKELCVVEYQLNKKGKGTMLFLDDDTDEDVPNAEECPQSDGDEEKEEAEDALIALMRERGIASDLVNEMLMKHQKNQSTRVNEENHHDFTTGDVSHVMDNYHKYKNKNALVSFGIYDTQKYDELLTTSKSMLNILEYHRMQEDEDRFENNALKKMLSQMVNDNAIMMATENLQCTQEALRFLEIHNEMELYEDIRTRYCAPQQNYSHPAMHSRNKIPRNSIEFARVLEIRDAIWSKCCRSLEIPFITEPYLSRRMMGICDHTGSVPDGKVFIQLRVQKTSPQLCECSGLIQPHKMKCDNDNCFEFVETFRSLHTVEDKDKVIMMESGALSPLSLQVFDAVSVPQLQKLFPNQNILIFSARDKHMVSALSGSSCGADDTSYLNAHGRCKWFDCIIVPEFYYREGQHVRLDRNKGNNTQASEYLQQFKMSFFPTAQASIGRAGFDKPLCLHPPPQPNALEENDEDMKYAAEEDEKDEDAIWDRRTSWIWDSDRDITNMNEYIEYFVRLNRVNYTEDWKERFEIECQLANERMGSPNCRYFMKLFAHYEGLVQCNYSVHVEEDKMYAIDKYPHYMQDKAIMMGKHVSTLCGHVFDAILAKLPRNLHHLVDESLINDPQRDYMVDVMDPQQRKWFLEKKEKDQNDRRCRHCNLNFGHWKQRKEHVEGEAHKRKMEELRANRGADLVQNYVDKVGVVKDSKIEFEEEKINDDDDDEPADWIEDVRGEVEKFMKRIETKLHEQKDRLLQEEPHLIYQQFKQWRLTLQENQKLLKGYERQFPPQWSEDVALWQKYLVTMEYKFKQRTIDMKYNKQKGSV